MIKFIKSVSRAAKTTILFIFITAIITFCIANRQPIILSLYPFAFQMETRVFVLVIISIIIGIIIGGGFLSINSTRLVFANSLNKRKIKKLQKDLSRKRR